MPLELSEYPVVLVMERGARLVVRRVEFIELRFEPYAAVLVHDEREDMAFDILFGGAVSHLSFLFRFTNQASAEENIHRASTRLAHPSL